MASSRSVLVDGLELGLVRFPVIEGLVLPTTVACEVVSGAGNELLLGERLEGAATDEMGTFESASGGE